MENKMLVALRQCQLSHLSANFEKEKITPDIISQISVHELEALGVRNRRVMMKLRTICTTFRGMQPMKTPIAGPPEFDIPKELIENLLEEDFKISEISNLLCVSESTIYRRMSRFCLSKMNFTDINDMDLDSTLGMIMTDFPLCGENMLRQMLSLKNIKVQRSRLRDSIHRLDTAGVEERRKNRLHRRVYNVAGPNHLWHIDTNHKLVRWKFVIVGGVDGFSRMVMFLRCTESNNSRTVLDCFLSGVAEYGIPNRVRSDKGLENVSVADYMLSMKGPESMITGKSTHNQRIERLWRDVFEGVLSYFYNLFYNMEDHSILDPLDVLHIAALHYIYSAEINRRLQFWAKAWAGHRIRTVGTSPRNLWMSGQLQNPVGVALHEGELQNYDVAGAQDVNQDDVEEGDLPIFDPPSHVLSEQCRRVLAEEILSPRHNHNFGIEDFRKCLEIIKRHTGT